MDIIDYLEFIIFTTLVIVCFLQVDIRGEEDGW